MAEPTPIDTPEFRRWLRRVVRRHTRRYLRAERRQRWRQWLTRGLHYDSHRPRTNNPEEQP